ncbi:PAS domain-containing sensor histidine kinase [Rufibacter quisquiliarum]|nr:PAS domain S-box protein [Rufibacter quisquiliarum]
MGNIKQNRRAATSHDLIAGAVGDAGFGGENYYKLLFENNPLPMWVFDTDSLRFLMVNNSAVSLYGYSKEEFLKMTIKDIRPQEQLTALIKEVSSQRNDLNHAGEWVHLKRDGSLLFVEVCSHVLPPDKGIARRLVVANDITARKQAELQLRESETKAQTILNNIVEIVFSFNGNMEMIYVSPQCNSILGYSPEDFYQDKYLWFNLVHPADRHLFEAALPNIKKSSEQFQLEYRIRTINGEEKWAITHCSAILDEKGVMVRLNGSLSDITARKKAEEGLKFSDFSIERASEAFIWVKPDSGILRVNRACCKLLGYAAEELEQLTMFDIAPMFEANEWQGHWQLLENQKSLTLETFLISSNGELHPVEMHWNHFVYNRQSYSFTSIREIGERKKAEQEKATLTEETARQNKHLQQFAYIVSHNLRAPVANIVGLTSLYNRVNPLDPINSVLISKLEKTSLRLDATIKDLNEILTIRSQADQKMEVVDLKESLKDVLESLALQISGCDALVTSDFYEGREVLGVKGYVNSIFLNLISNAIKYRDPNRRLEIHIKTVFSDSYLCLLLKDNGLGIDLTKQRHKVFGLYRRFHPYIEGKGLGLHMVKTQVETLGGWVDLDSAVGEGSTFKIFLQAPPKDE